MLPSPIDNILVEKAKRQMHLRNGDSIVKTYRISLGKNPVGAKVKSGDIMIHGYPNKVPAFLFQFWHSSLRMLSAKEINFKNKQYGSRAFVYGNPFCL